MKELWNSKRSSMSPWESRIILPVLGLDPVVSDSVQKAGGWKEHVGCGRYGKASGIGGSLRQSGRLRIPRLSGHDMFLIDSLWVSINAGGFASSTDYRGRPYPDESSI